MRSLMLCGVVAGLFLTAGCGGGASGAGDRVPVFEVSGKVTLNGAPLADASITFSPLTQGNPAAIGRTDSQGVYRLTTYEANDGAAAGDYKVLVSKYIPDTQIAEESEEGHGTDPDAIYDTSSHSAAGGGTKVGGNMVPPQYGSPSGSPLVATVKEDSENNFDFNLL